MVADESDFQLQNSAQAIEYAREAIRSGILINGGAAVAVLALLSGERTLSNFNVNAIWWALIAFAVGVLAAFIACAVAYGAQTLFAMHNADRIAGKTSSDRNAKRVSAAAVGLIFICAVCFGVGVWLSAQGLVAGS